MAFGAINNSHLMHIICYLCMLPVYRCLTNKPKLSSQPIKCVSHSKAEADWVFKGLGRAIK